MIRRYWSLGIVIGVLIAGNIIVSCLLGLGDAEALYHAYSRHLSLSYLDHPPLIGWLIRCSTAAVGQHVLGVRLVPMVMTTLGMIFMVLLTREMFGTRAAHYVAPLLFATPLFSIGLTAATPDAPLFALWPLYLWQLYVTINDKTRGFKADVGRPVLLGTLLGLAFLSKYTGALLLVSTLSLVLAKGNRFWLRRPGFWLGGSVAMILTLPVMVWNFDHGFAGVSHRLQWTQTGAGFSLRNAGALLGGQLLYVGPLMLILLFGAARIALGRQKRDNHTAWKQVIWSSLPPLIATYILVLWSDVAEPHWPAAGYLGLYPGVAALVAEGSSFFKRMYRFALGFGVIVYAVMHLLVLTPLLPLLTPEGAYEPKYDLANELRGWPEAADTIRAVNKNRRPVTAAFYTQCAQLAFVLNEPKDPSVFCVSEEMDDFDIWHGPFELREEGTLFVTDNRFDHDVAALFPDGRVDAELPIEIQRSGVLARRFTLIFVSKK